MEILKKACIQLIRFYQKFISPLSPPSCRFHPTCSHYAVEAMETHGALKGSWLAVMRILKCHPFHKGGFDPVPPKKSETK
ncbi:membrane protein insertion efficiency factor YidD [Sporosarcina sp. P34]|uniref:membrane protein insertion efficiency factor YidD n=1 Tax=Sporosarcina sp. P34 TaxID=2048247 RepID=UPI000C16DBDE|nr:membrane protein insertion efficiency factor YidD [Sporosarcina sp. P34]